MKKCPKCNIELSTEDFFCYNCGTKLFDAQPAETSTISANSQTSTTPETIIQTSPNEQNYSSNNINLQNIQKTNASRKTNVYLPLLLVFFVLIILGVAVFLALIYTGNIKKEQLSFIPKSILNTIPITSQDQTSFSEVTTHYVAFSMTILKNNKKAIVTTVFNNSHTKSNTRDGAEIYYRNFAKNKITDFMLYKNHFIYQFSNFGDALDKRKEIINDLNSKGYQINFIEIN